MELTTETQLVYADPLEAVEQAVISEQYAYERDDGEIHLAVPGDWRDHQIWFAWRPELDVLHVCASLEIKIPDARYRDACELVARLNERLWLGHFDLWAEDGAIIFRHAITCPGGETVSGAQAISLIHAAKEAGDRLYPAFHYLMWGGKSVDDAVSAAMFDTVGQA